MVRPTGRIFHTAVEYKGNMFVVGGRNEKILDESCIWFFHVSKCFWKRITVESIVGDSFRLKRAGHISFVHNDSLYNLGGYSDDQDKLEKRVQPGITKIHLPSITHLLTPITVAVKEIKSVRDTPAVPDMYKMTTFKSSLSSQYLEEVITLSKLNNPNIVKFYGLTAKSQIILEYCPLGSLYDLLYVKQNEILLSWPLKISIALDLVLGLSHLQQDFTIPILHRDLRSVNCLLVSLNLHDPVRAKIADFGLSLSATDRSGKYLQCFALVYFRKSNRKKNSYFSWEPSLVVS